MNTRRDTREYPVVILKRMANQSNLKIKIFGLWAIYPPSGTVIALDNILGVEILAVSIRWLRKILSCKPRFRHCLTNIKVHLFFVHNFMGLEEFSV